MDVNAVQNTASGKSDQYNRERLTVKLSSVNQHNQSAVIVDPSIAKKLEASKSSISEELNLMNSEKQRREKNQEVLKDFKEQLMQLELILQSAVASLAFDPTSLENARDRIASQLGNNSNRIKFVELPELEQALKELNSDNSSLDNREDTEKLRLTINSAVAEVDRKISQSAGAGRQKQTEKTLQVAHQNADAILSTSNPRDIFSSSDKAAEFLRDNNIGAQVHARLTPGVVIDLLS